MDDYSDRRKETRKKVMAFTTVYDANKNMLLGYLRDLTLQGALVVGEKMLEVDKPITLAIELPGDVPDINVKRLTVSARVARCAEDESPRNYKLGFEFKAVTLEQKHIIEALLERYHFRHKMY